MSLKVFFNDLLGHPLLLLSFSDPVMRPVFPSPFDEQAFLFGNAFYGERTYTAASLPDSQDLADIGNRRTFQRDRDNRIREVTLIVNNIVSSGNKSS